MEYTNIKKIRIIKHPRKVKVIVKKLERSRKKSNDIKTIIIKPHKVVEGDHKYYAIKDKEEIQKLKKLKRIGGNIKKIKKKSKKKPKKIENKKKKEKKKEKKRRRK